MRTRLLALLLALGFALAAPPIAAVEPDEVLADPALETRARELSKLLRCLVCQNQSIDDSNADLARDLRILLRERLSAGDSDDEAIRYIVDRYGDFVLLEPPMKVTTYLLWYGPAAILGGALLGLVVFYRRRRTAAARPSAVAPLSDAEQARLKDLLGGRSER
jgi:cytochrome c-type biogenesis protein CcmH